MDLIDLACQRGCETIERLRQLSDRAIPDIEQAPQTSAGKQGLDAERPGSSHRIPDGEHPVVIRIFDGDQLAHDSTFHQHLPARGEYGECADTRFNGRNVDPLGQFFIGDAVFGKC